MVSVKFNIVAGSTSVSLYRKFFDLISLEDETLLFTGLLFPENFKRIRGADVR